MSVSPLLYNLGSPYLVDASLIIFMHM